MQPAHPGRHVAVRVVAIANVVQRLPLRAQLRVRAHQMAGVEHDAHVVVRDAVEQAARHRRVAEREPGPPLVFHEQRHVGVDAVDCNDRAVFRNTSAFVVQSFHGGNRQGVRNGEERREVLPLTRKLTCDFVGRTHVEPATLHNKSFIRLNAGIFQGIQISVITQFADRTIVG